MPWIVCRKPSGVNYVQLVAGKDECILYDVAHRELFSQHDDAEKKCKELEKERGKRHRALMASQMVLLDVPPDPRIDYI